MSGARDGGFTLIETVVTLVVGGILMATATMGMHAYVVSTRESGTADQVRSTLRNAQEQAVSEGRTYCVFFTSTTWTVYKSDCTVAADKSSGPYQVADSSLQLSSISFTPPSPSIPNDNTACPVTGQCAYFYPRGTALPGSLQVTRPGKTYSISVEGLTGRVSLA